MVYITGLQDGGENSMELVHGMQQSNSMIHVNQY